MLPVAEATGFIPQPLRGQIAPTAKRWKMPEITADQQINASLMPAFLPGITFLPCTRAIGCTAKKLWTIEASRLRGVICCALAVEQGYSNGQMDAQALDAPQGRGIKACGFSHRNTCPPSFLSALKGRRNDR